MHFIFTLYVVIFVLPCLRDEGRTPRHIGVTPSLLDPESSNPCLDLVRCRSFAEVSLSRDSRFLDKMSHNKQLFHGPFDFLVVRHDKELMLLKATSVTGRLKAKVFKLISHSFKDFEAFKNGGDWMELLCKGLIGKSKLFKNLLHSGDKKLSLIHI